MASKVQVADRRFSRCSSCWVSAKDPFSSDKLNDLVFPFVLRMWTSCSCSQMAVWLPWSSSAAQEPFCLARREAWWDTRSPLTARLRKNLWLASTWVVSRGNTDLRNFLVLFFVLWSTLSLSLSRLDRLITDCAKKKKKNNPSVQENFTSPSLHL